jgi:hypothetical protein
MKTIEEIKQHLKEVGYTKSALKNIRFYLLGQDIIDNVDEIAFNVPRGQNHFEDFLMWFKTDEEDDEDYNVLDTVLEFVNGKHKVLIHVVEILDALDELGFQIYHPDFDHLLNDDFEEEYEEEEDDDYVPAEHDSESLIRELKRRGYNVTKK